MPKLKLMCLCLSVLGAIAFLLLDWTSAPEQDVITSLILLGGKVFGLLWFCAGVSILVAPRVGGWLFVLGELFGCIFASVMACVMMPTNLFLCLFLSLAALVLWGVFGMCYTAPSSLFAELEDYLLLEKQ